MQIAYKLVNIIQYTEAAHKTNATIERPQNKTTAMQHKQDIPC